MVARITAAQTDLALAFCADNYEKWDGTWPANFRTAPVLVDFCSRTGITAAQLKRQFSKVKAERTGRGVGTSGRGENGQQLYEDMLLEIIGAL